MPSFQVRMALGLFAKMLPAAVFAGDPGSPQTASARACSRRTAWRDADVWNVPRMTQF
jgi:hypothetical protein